MPALLPRLSAASVGAAVALAVLGAPTAALAAAPSDPGAAGAARAAQQGPAALPTQAADAARSATSSTTAAPAGVGSAGGAAAGRSTAEAAATRTERPAASAGRSAAEQRATTRSATVNTPAAKPAKPAQPAKAVKVDKPAQPAQGDKPAKPAKAAKVQTVPSKGKDERPGATGKDNGDPRGNNGTFKVDGPVLDTSHGNEPQVDCAFRLNFYGYDAGQLATIVFTPVSPTPGASTTVSGRQLISTDAAKGGLYNGSYPVTGTWTAADLGLDPTVRQHVKVSVESLNADGSDVPGGAKHKVFWLHPCGSTVPVAVTAAAAPQAPAAETAALPAALPVGPRTILAAPAAQPATAALPVMGPHTQPQPQAQVLGATLTAQAAQGATVVAAPAQGSRATTATAVAPLARPLPQPAMLPFTGSPQLIALMIGGLVALLGGAALVAAARTSA